VVGGSRRAEIEIVTNRSDWTMLAALDALKAPTRHGRAARWGRSRALARARARDAKNDQTAGH
jgi:hypothetical protein